MRFRQRLARRGEGFAERDASRSVVRVTTPDPVMIPAPRRGLAKKAAAELIGTFALVLAGCGSIVVDAQYGGIGHPGISLAFGLVVMVMIYAIGHISGAHINPAVTVAFACIGRFPWREVPLYLLYQIVGGVLACVLISQGLGTEHGLGATLPSGSLLQAFLVEVVITFFLMFVITAVATDARAVGHMAGWAIGATVALCALIAGPLTGASMNPARSIGPALVGGNVADLWLYIVAPVIGAVLGGLAYQYIRCDTDDPGDVAGCC